MRRRSIQLVPLVLVPFMMVAAACGSTTDTVGSVDTSSTTPSENADGVTVPETQPVADAPSESTTTTTTTGVGDDDTPDVTTVSDGTAITQVSPRAVPALTTAPTQPRPNQSGEFPLDPSSARVQATVTDLAERLGVLASEVTIVEATAVTWGDSSLGCPQPGMRYLQRVTDGSLVILNVDGVDYRYTGGDPLKFCRA